MSTARVNLFLACFLVAFSIQATLWSWVEFSDHDRWIERTDNLITDFTTTPRTFIVEDQSGSRYGGHPGTSIIVTAAVLTRIGLSTTIAISIGVALINAILIAILMTLCHTLRPQLPWWLAAGAITMLHPLSFYSSPTNAIIGPLLAALVVLILWLFERPNQATTRHMVLFGVLTGLGLATRLPITIFISAPLLVFLHTKYGTRRLAPAVLVAIVTGIALNPVLWFSPLEYTRYMLVRSTSHLVVDGSGISSLALQSFLLYAPHTILAVVFFIGVLFITRHSVLPFSRQFLLVLLLVTLSAAAIFFIARFKTLRYFFPLFVIWDVLFPLLILHLAASMPLQGIASLRRKQQIRHLTVIAVAVLIAGAHILHLTYSLLSPLPRGIV